ANGAFNDGRALGGAPNRGARSTTARGGLIDGVSETWWDGWVKRSTTARAKRRVHGDLVRWRARSGAFNHGRARSSAFNPGVMGCVKRSTKGAREAARSTTRTARRRGAAPAERAIKT